MSTWANPADALSRNKPIESWCASLPKLPSTPTAVLASAPALSELNLLREPLSAAVHTAAEHVRKLESFGTFGYSELKPAYVDTEFLQMTHAGESNSMPSKVRQMSRDSVKTDRRDAKADGTADYLRTSCRPCDDPIFIAPIGSMGRYWGVAGLLAK